MGLPRTRSLWDSSLVFSLVFSLAHCAGTAVQAQQSGGVIDLSTVQLPARPSTTLAPAPGFAQISLAQIPLAQIPLPTLAALSMPDGGPAGEDDAGSPSAPLPDAPLPDDPGVRLEQDLQASGSSPQGPSGVAAPPASPATTQPAAANETPLEQGRQTKRILYIVPNFRAVSADSHLPPQPVKEKLTTAMEDSFDYSSFIFVGIQAGIGQVGNSYPEFGEGLRGYGRYYWHTFADDTDENLWVEFLLPVALHQDTRYYTLGRGGIGKRFVYALSRAAITRNDDGHETFNASEIFGAGTAAAISGLYYPSQERTVVKFYQRWVTNLLIDSGTFAFKEFWPDINNAIFHQKT